MILKRILIGIALLHNALFLLGQAAFKNVVVTSSEGRVTIDYDLQPTVERAVLKAVRLTVVFKGKTIAPETVGGAIGTDVSFGLGRRLIWDCAADGRLLSGKAEILLEADCEVLPPPPPPVQSFEPETVLVEGGTFQMGSENELPIHEVTLSSFRMGKYEVTLKQFRCFIESSGYQTDAEKYGDSWVYENNDWHTKKGVTWKCDVAGTVRPSSEDNHPVIHVSWNDATAYCQWLSKKTGKTYRLPTEAEWEYAAKGGRLSQNYKYSGSNELNDVAWYSENAAKKTHVVGGKQQNELGLYDLSGNVWEWCEDWYGSYSSNAIENPKGAATGSIRVNRGGSWGNYSGDCRPSYRGSNTPTYRFSYIGFRLIVLLQ
jgi:formylglycine-generating enzyme required for sulfatase activity